MGVAMYKMIAKPMNDRGIERYSWALKYLDDSFTRDRFNSDDNGTIYLFEKLEDLIWFSLVWE